MPAESSISLPTATSITIANMVGTGVFTSLGFQVVDLKSGFPLLLLWILGGVFALCGALSYSELAAALPRSGGEFNFLSRIYHPSIGFLAGWISFTAGFAAPIALSAMAFGSYLSQVVNIPPLILSCGAVVLVTLFHLRSLRIGSYFQNVATLFKIALILLFIGAAFALNRAPTEISFLPAEGDLEAISSLPFGISLLYVMFAYSGWNAATYVVGEVKKPARDVPKALFLGTSVVLVLYVALNAIFLHTTPIDKLAGQIEIGHIVATHVFGPTAGKVTSTLLSIALISTISAMVWAGPRVTQTMGEDYPFFAVLARTNRAGIPALAILLQSGLVLAMLITSSFDEVLVYTQFTLTASSFLTVLGVFVLRWRAPNLDRPYKTWGYPLTPLLFVIMSLVIMVYTFVDRPRESLAGLATLAVGLALHTALSRRDQHA